MTLQSYEMYQEVDQKADGDEDCNLTFVTSPWSTKCLVYDDYLYNCHSTHGNKVYWRCHNYSRYGPLKVEDYENLSINAS